MIRLRPAQGADRFRLRRWLDDPALPLWWGTSSSVEAEIAMALEAHNPYLTIIEKDAQPVGIALAADAAMLGGVDRPATVEAGTYAIDVFVALPETRAADSTAAIALAAAEVFATSFAIACCSLVSIKSEPVARAYERAGFTWREIWHDRYRGPCWVMLLPRPR
ncbi:MAG: GNAT family N-acetyltransferase [Hyphomicrobiales bacterium]|nr:MAG: GNAT family N-acetyltransferase [Hyphomicrobiales bacterium]